MLLKAMRVLCILLLALSVHSPASAPKKSSTKVYLENLYNQTKNGFPKLIRIDELPPDKAKVIITLESEIQPEKIEQSSYIQVLRPLRIINGIIAVVDRDKIEYLKTIEGIKDIALDAKVKVWPREQRERIEQIILQQTGIIVGWNLQEPGIAAANTPPDGNPPTSYGAWSTYSVDGTGVIIAILDTGVNYTLADLDAPNYLGGYDFINNDSDPMDDNGPPTEGRYGHGTIVSTIAVAQGDEKIEGVAPNASYYAVKVLDSLGGSDMSHVILGLDWCVNTANPKPDIVNMSLGALNPGPSLKAQLEAACDAAYNAGIILVASSGNDTVTYSAYPAACKNVISAGGHAQDQTLYSKSNGEVDVVAPARRVPSMDMSGDASWLYNGTSYASPHVAGLLALQLQYARQNDIAINNGYQWETVKHSAIDMPLIPDPVFKGKGKARALKSIGLLASNWPIDHDFNFSDYAFFDSNYPVYQIGSDVNQTITLTNTTDILGNTVETIEDLNVVATQVYYSDPNDQNLPGDSVEIFPTISLLEPNDANSITLSLLYTIPPETAPGLVKTTLELEFNFVGNSRVITVAYNEPNSLWYAAIPADVDLDNDVDLLDFVIFSQSWQQTACTEPDWCERADIDRSGEVDFFDLRILAENWLTGL